MVLAWTGRTMRLHSLRVPRHGPHHGRRLVSVSRAASVGSGAGAGAGTGLSATDSRTGLTFDSHDAWLAALMALREDPLDQVGGRIVPFRGSPVGRVMVIGEAPGATEDELGKPFGAGKIKSLHKPSDSRTCCIHQTP